LPSYQSLERELQKYKTPAGTPDWDTVRRLKLKAMEDYTKRPMLVYATDFLNTEKTKAVGNEIQIDFSDKHGFFEITDEIPDKAVDVLIHSPGGLPDAAESIVAMLRGKFDHVRFFVPNIAKSAATMMTMSADEVWMNGHSELGPVDPQLVFRKGDGSIVQAPAQAIVDQFDEAQALIGKDPTKLPAWLPILQQYGPSLYKEARNAIELSTKLVEEWLTQYMFAGQGDGPQKAKSIAAYLGDHNQFKSHGRRIGRKALQDKGANVKNLEDDKELQNRVTDLYYAIVHTFNGGAFKIFENSRGQSHFRVIQQISVPLQLGQLLQQKQPVPGQPMQPQKPGQKK
jgi:ATP-dependent protease ClpP protease subunit